jgi:hypothetical protein
MKLALYKGRTRLFNRAVCWWLRSNYSHAEIVFSDGMCGSASHTDGGVRLKLIDLTPDKWDVFEIKGDEVAARNWFNVHAGQKYDVLGLLGFVWRRGTQDGNKWFCFEACGASLGAGLPHLLTADLLRDFYAGR